MMLLMISLALARCWWSGPHRHPSSSAHLHTRLSTPTTWQSLKVGASWRRFHSSWVCSCEPRLIEGETTSTNHRGRLSTMLDVIWELHHVGLGLAEGVGTSGSAATYSGAWRRRVVTTTSATVAQHSYKLPICWSIVSPRVSRATHYCDVIKVNGCCWIHVVLLHRPTWIPLAQQPSVVLRLRKRCCLLLLLSKLRVSLLGSRCEEESCL